MSGACKIMEANKYTSLDQMLTALRVGDLNSSSRKDENGVASASAQFTLSHSCLFHLLDEEHAEVSL